MRGTATGSWPVFPVVAAVLVLYILFLVLLPSPSWWRGFCSGLFVGALTVALVWLVHLFSGSHNALFGTLGEQATAEVLQSRRMRRSGWRIVNGLSFAGHGDVDHSLVGPGGIFAVESKWTNQTWEIGSRGRTPAFEQALVQARIGARKITSELRALRLGSDQTVHPVIVVWGPGAPVIPEGFVDLDGVVVIEGRQLGSWACSRGDRVLGSQEADDIYRALLAELSDRKPTNDRPGVRAHT
jgi:hypothetical protein